jgi:pimeloyl-ACP methyl ester carboxylesterase
MVQFPRQISEKSTDPVSLKLFKYEKALRNFDSSDVLIVWPNCDPGFTMKLLDEYWRADFPRSKVVLVERASHYIQEDAPAEVISEISLFLAERDR